MFNKYFSNKSIVGKVVQYRTRHLRKQRRASSADRLFGNVTEAPVAPHDEEIAGLCPPLSEVIHLKAKTRRGRSQEKILRMELERTMLLALGANDRSEPWMRALRAFVNAVREKVSHGPVAPLMPCELILKKKTGHKYRPIARYSLLDGIVEGGTARYLLDIFASDFLPNSLAHAADPEGPSSRNGGVKDLLAYRRKYKKLPLYVAEVDLKSCYDTVHADIVRQALSWGVERAIQRGVVVDPRALAVAEAYLRGYSFSRFVVPRADAQFKTLDPEGKVPWPEEELKQRWGQDARGAPIGIPQGGSLSNLFITLVLDAADRSVLEGADAELLYLRFLDDVIFVHPREEVVHSALDRYLKTVRTLGLLPHPIAPSRSYDHKHWRSKSRGPYAWARSRASGHAPWVQFLGYQIRHDGLLRIRPETIEKECTKLGQTVNWALRAARRRMIPMATSAGNPFPGDRIVASIERKLIAHLMGHPVGDQGRCWRSAFQLLVGNPFVRDQLRVLDRRRGEEIARLVRGLREIAPVSPPGASSTRRARGRQGHTTSYMAAFATINRIDTLRRGFEERDAFPSERGSYEAEEQDDGER